MTIKEMEKKLEKLGYWVLEVGGLYKLQAISTGEIFEQTYNIELLESKLEELIIKEVEEIKDVEVRIIECNLLYGNEDWEIDEDHIQTLEEAIDFLKSSIGNDTKIGNFDITKNFDISSLNFDSNGTAKVVETNDYDRCIYFQKV